MAYTALLCKFTDPSRNGAQNENKSAEGGCPSLLPFHVRKNGISILYTPVMLRLLGQSEYGLYQFAFKVVGYLGILNFGFGKRIYALLFQI